MNYLLPKKYLRKLFALTLVVIMLGTGIGTTNIDKAYANELQLSPIQKPISASVVAHTLFINSQGRVAAVGDNWKGQLGRGAIGGSSTSIQVVSSVSNAVHVDTGWNTSLAVTSNGELWMWGLRQDANHANTLGYGEIGSPTKITGIPQVVQASTGNSQDAHTLAVSRTGDVYAWGAQRDGKLGNGVNHSSNDLATPYKIPNLHNIVMVEAGDNFSTALSANGDVYWWGRGQTTPMKKDGLSNIVKISTKTGTFMALDRYGNVYNWNTGTASPTKINGLANIVDISPETALSVDDKVYVWGSGYIGDGGSTGSTIPVLITEASPDQFTDIRGISGSIAARFAIRQNGDVYSWGRGLTGHLGHGNTSNYIIPTKIGSINILTDNLPSFEHYIDPLEEEINTGATLAVEIAEQTLLVLDYDNAIIEVEKVKDVVLKDQLKERLDVVKQYIDAIAIVEVAEETRSRDDIDSARIEVLQLPDGDLKDSLLNRLDEIIIDEPNDEPNQVAIEAVEEAEATLSKMIVDYNKAVDAVSKVEDEGLKQELEDRLRASLQAIKNFVQLLD